MCSVMGTHCSHNVILQVAKGNADGRVGHGPILMGPSGVNYRKNRNCAHHPVHERNRLVVSTVVASLTRGGEKSAPTRGPHLQNRGREQGAMSNFAFTGRIF